MFIVTQKATRFIIAKIYKCRYSSNRLNYILTQIHFTRNQFEKREEINTINNSGKNETKFGQENILTLVSCFNQTGELTKKMLLSIKR